MDNPEISITQALNQIQSWLNAGEYEKVTQGCQEILSIEPGNQRALSMMRQAEEKRFAQQNPEPNFEQEPVQEPAPVQEPTPAPTFEPPSLEEELFQQSSIQKESPIQDPLAKLEVESKTQPIQNYSHPYELQDKKKMFLAMLIPAVLVVIIGGSLIWWLGREKTDESNIADNGETETTDQQQVTEEKNLDYLQDNEERVQILVDMADVLDNYYVQNGTYPSVDEIDSVLIDSEKFESLPADPKQGEFDKAGKEFGYTYAVYETVAGKNTAYIVSALFEDSRGFAYAWTRGASTRDYSDYRDTKEDHVVFISE